MIEDLGMLLVAIVLLAIAGGQAILLYSRRKLVMSATALFEESRCVMNDLNAECEALHRRNNELREALKTADEANCGMADYILQMRSDMHLLSMGIRETVVLDRRHLN